MRAGWSQGHKYVRRVRSSFSADPSYFTGAHPSYFTSAGPP